MFTFSEGRSVGPPLGSRSPSCAPTRVAPKSCRSSQELPRGQGAKGPRGQGAKRARGQGARRHSDVSVSAQLGLRAPRGGIRLADGPLGCWSRLEGFRTFAAPETCGISFPKNPWVITNLKMFAILLTRLERRSAVAHKSENPASLYGKRGLCWLFLSDQLVVFLRPAGRFSQTSWSFFSDRGLLKLPRPLCGRWSSLH